MVTYTDFQYFLPAEEVCDINIFIIKENPLYWEGELGQNLMTRTMGIGHQEFEHIKIEIGS